MNKSRLTLALSLAALLGGGLLLPGAASAHDRDSSQRSEYSHHGQRGERHEQHGRHKHYATDSWYLQRHREARHHDYRPIKYDYRVHGKHHRHQRHSDRYQPRHYQPLRSHHDRHDSSPVHLQIGYRIVL